MPSVEELFKHMPQAFDAAAAAGFEATVQFKLSGEGGGEWNVSIADGKVDVEKGAVEDPTATIMMDAQDYADMISGELNPMVAFMQGKVKVEGDLNTVMKFQTLFNN